MITRQFTRKLVMMFGAIALLVALVLIVSSFTGFAAQSASAGVVFPIENMALGVVCLVLGAVSARYFRSAEAAVVPFSFMFILIAGLATHSDFSAFKPLVGMAVGLLMVAVFLAYHVRMVIWVACAGAVASANVLLLPVDLSMAQPLYFVFGMSISCLILLGAGMCFSLAIKGVRTGGVSGKPSAIVYQPRFTIV
jgi:hypothetical protein